MRSRLRLFLLVGLAATALDVGTLLALQERGLLLADVVALVLAATMAYLLNRHITFRRRPLARWVRRPTLFGATALAAGLVDVGVLVVLNRLGLAVPAAKVLAVGAAATVRWVAYRRILFHQVRQEMAQRLDRPPAPGAKRLSVVVPAYNEGGLIEATLAAIRAELDLALEPGSYEILVVDDGSTDDTAERAQAAGANVLRLAANQGKGGAVRAGMLAADGRTVVFTDADLAYSPRLVLEVLDRVEQGWDVVVGSRRHDDTNTLVRARHLRELGGRVINVLTHLVLLGNFHDTQCGIKGFRGDIARAVFERTRINGFAFDVEIFLIAEQDQLSLTEIPVSVTNRAASSVRIVGDTAELLVDLFRIRRWAGEGRYRPTAAQAEILNTGSPIS
ncbi:MAG: glycosyltransferase [Acidimicrobiia bacterium]|nr:glycosyltransferase [Acidimicrobiia bacterium]MDH4365671.1 glycosyltransferase [Acidimicrobiia bacterium]